MLRKSLVFALIVILSLSLIVVGCGQQQVAKDAPKEKAKKEEPKKEDIKYPVKPIKIIVPWSAGGSSDSMARAFSAVAEKHLGQTLVVVNREGAGGTIATTEVKAAKPDGYTIMLNAVGVFTSQPVMREVTYQIDDFEAVTGLSYEPIVLAVRTDSPYSTFEDLKNAGKTIKYSSSGTGGLPHLAQAALYDKAGMKADHVPNKGGAAAITALLGGHVEAIAAHPGELLPHVKDGKFRMLGIFSPERFDMIKDVPTFKEMGYDLDFSVWKFILTPKGVDTQIIAKLSKAFNAMMKDPEFVKFTETANLTMQPIAGGKVKDKLKNEAAATKEVLEKLGLAKK